MISSILLAVGVLAATPLEGFLRTETRILATDPAFKEPKDLSWTLPKYAEQKGQKITVDIPEGVADDTCLVKSPLDLTPFIGKGVSACISIAAENVSEPRHNWNGVKFQIYYEEDGAKHWQDTTLHPIGTFEAQTFPIDFPLRKDAKITNAHLAIGLQECHGKVVFDLSTLKIAATSGLFKRLDEPFTVSYPPEIQERRCRGVMSPGGNMNEDDFKTLHDWNVNLIRYQMVRGWASENGNADLEEYNQWLEGRLNHLDTFVLPMAEKYGIKVVIDVHVFPKGVAKGGEINMLHDLEAAKCFLQNWRKIATRFKGRKAIYGYDLANELVQRQRSELTDYWNLQYAAARIVRAIDPETPIIVGANMAENPSCFEYLSPLPMTNIIYQVHMYQPFEFTHFRVFDRKGVDYDHTVKYPCVRKTGEVWDKEFLRKVLAPVREFQLKYGARIYAGEFSAAAWDIGADLYLADCISLFEEYGWDWSYHAFREAYCWSVEHAGDSPFDLQPAAETPRKQVLLKGFAPNKPFGQP